MKNKFILLLCGLLLAMGQSALAQTPDGETPAEEVVCNPLKADGVTKGLYGLCVAFCEAQDHAALSDSITEQELDALADQAPSGRILTNYNKKKTETDPPMPCIKVEEPCPCWTSEEAAAIDGTMADGSTASRFQCSTGQTNTNYLIERGAGEPTSQSWIQWGVSAGGFCIYNRKNNPDDAYTNLSVAEGTLTLEQFQSCKDSMASAIKEAQGFGCTEDL